MHNQARGVDLENYGESVLSLADITQTAIINNTQSGLYVGNGVARLTNVTVSGNGAGIRVAEGNLTLAYSTIAHNIAWGLRLDNADASADLQNSIVALNATGQDCVSTVTRVNQDAASLACGAPEVTAATLRLSPDLELANGTQLYSLQTGSMAIDAAIGPCPATDQRGYARPVDGPINGVLDGRPVCDVGAYEFGAGLHLEIATPGVETPTPTQGLLILLPTDTATPGAVTLLLDKNANCRKGPGTVYSVLTSVLAGQTVQLIGRNAQNTWWLSIIPGDFKCWISTGTGQPQGDPNLLPVLPDPPTPIPTAKPGTGGVDFDKDGYTADKDCNDKDANIYPGAPETPDDKVDSNCNGDDDK